MSYYSDDRPRRQRSYRDRRPREYTEEESYLARGGVDPRDARRMDLVPRRRDSDDSVEEIQRDFAPGDGGYVRRKTTVREGVRPARRARSVGRYDDDTYDDRRSDYPGRRRREKRERRSRRNDYSSESSPSRSPPRRRDSMTEKALAALGLSGAAGALAGRSRSRSRARSVAGSRATSRGRRARSYSSERSRSRSRGGINPKVAQAVKAALAAGAAEAFRARKEPGGWGGDKGKRIITAALGAAGVDGLIDRDPDKHSKRHIVESALAGLATNRIVNGPRSRSRGPGNRSRDRSQSRGGIKDIAAGGILAAAGKQLVDRVRSRSRGRGRSPSVSSYSSYDSRSPPRRREKKRSKSISDMARKGIAALGIGDAAEKRRSRRGSYSSSDDDYSRDVGQPRSMTAATSQVSSPPPGRFGNEAHHLGDPNTDSDSDLGSSTDEERRHKKSKKRQMLTAGLATVATIHAAHNVYQSVEARNERHKLVKEGELSPQEARKEKNKARLQDAAAIGIAALGIKGAVSEWKEVKEARERSREEEEKRERHRQKRAARKAKMTQMQQDGMLPYNSSYASSAPNLQNPANPTPYRPNPYVPPQYQPTYSNGSGPVYYDDNPYAYANAARTSASPQNGTPGQTPQHGQ